MTKRTIYSRGDIVRLNLNPTQGREQQGNMRPVLVLSDAPFNALGMVLVAPITQGNNFARDAGFAASLDGAGTKTQGVVLLNQVKMVDIATRNPRRIERAPDFVVGDAIARLQAILD